jgi:hypothetical protein
MGRTGNVYKILVETSLKATLIWATFRLLRLISCLVNSSALKMETIYYSEASSSLRTTQRYNPEDHTVHSYRRENLNPTLIYQFFAVFRSSLVFSFISDRHNSVVANGIALSTPQCTVGTYFSLCTNIHLAQDRHQWLVIVSELL